MANARKLPRGLKGHDDIFDQFYEWYSWRSSGTVLQWLEEKEDQWYKCMGLIRSDSKVLSNVNCDMFNHKWIHPSESSLAGYFAVRDNGFTKGLSLGGEYRFDSDSDVPYQDYITGLERLITLGTEDSE